VADKKSTGTPAIMAAQSAGVWFQLHTYSHDSHLRDFGREAAEALGVSPSKVFKTLLAEVDADSVCALVPVEAKLNLKALAATHGGKRAVMMEPARAERLSGYVVGGISPLGQRTALPTYVDDSAEGFPTIFISAGKRGWEIELTCAALVQLTGGRLAHLRST
jgi:Cys-tRNA(Pro)/Cys-tRNA(Cys) deacylase